MPIIIGINIGTNRSENRRKGPPPRMESISEQNLGVSLHHQRVSRSFTSILIADYYDMERQGKATR